MMLLQSNIENMLSLDYDYLYDIPRPYDPWGAMSPNEQVLFELEL